MSEEEIFKRAFTFNGKYNVNFEKTITNEEIELVDGWYTDSFSIKESVIRKKLNIEVHPKCPYCGRPVKIIPISRGYLVMSVIARNVKANYGLRMPLSQIYRNTGIDGQTTYKRLRRLN